jgi:hypothetical protein
MRDGQLARSIHAWFADFMRALKTPKAANVVPLAPAKLSPLRATGDGVWPLAN